MRVSQFLIILPVLLQVALSLTIAVLRLRQRGNPPADERLVETYRAQFELPVLFYAGCLFAYAMRIVDASVLFFAMLFALAQITGAVCGLGLRNDRGEAAGGLISVLAAAALWTMLGLHFFNNGF